MKPNKALTDKPRSLVIERTAAQMAAVFYEAGMNMGATSRYKSARHFARANVERFVPKAVEYLLEMLNRPDVSNHMKDEIYTAIMERVHDEQTNVMQDNKLPDINIKKYLDHKPEQPIIVNTKKKSEYEIMRK
jgi:hypothetical protein